MGWIELFSAGMVKLGEVGNLIRIGRVLGDKCWWDTDCVGWRCVRLSITKLRGWT